MPSKVWKHLQQVSETHSSKICAHAQSNCYNFCLYIGRIWFVLSEFVYDYDEKLDIALSVLSKPDCLPATANAEDAQMPRSWFTTKKKIEVPMEPPVTI